MSTACGRPQGGSGLCGRMWTEGGSQNSDFFGYHKWIALNYLVDQYIVVIVIKLSSVDLVVILMSHDS